MILAQAMTSTEWTVWIIYEVAVAIVAFAKTVLWFRRGVRDTRAALGSWESLLLVALLGAIGLSQWRGTQSLTALIAFGLASAMILGAALNAAHDRGLKEGRRGPVEE